jgi:hypothetical protein
MGDSNRFHREATIFLDGGRDRGDQFRSSDGFLRIEVAHVGGRFPCFNFLYDDVDRHFLQALNAVGSIDHLFNFLIAFAGPGEIGDKIPSARHAAVSEGYSRLDGSMLAGQQSADR